MAVSLLRYANREKVAQALTEQGYSVTRMTVNRWAKGAEMPEIAARMIAALYGLGEPKEAPRPEWAEELLEEIAAIRKSQQTAADLLAALAAVRSPSPRSDGGREGDQSSSHSDGKHGR